MVGLRKRSALASPLPAGESVGRLWRPSLLKNAEAKLRLSRIVRCAAGEGPIRESGCVERPLTRSLRGVYHRAALRADPLAPASTSPLRGEVRRSRVNLTASCSRMGPSGTPRQTNLKERAMRLTIE